MCGIGFAFVILRFDSCGSLFLAIHLCPHRKFEARVWIAFNILSVFVRKNAAFMKSYQYFLNAGCPTHSRGSNEWAREAEYVILSGHS
jgi:hypothetical protein